MMKIDGREFIVEDFGNSADSVDPNHVETFIGWLPVAGLRYADLSQRQKQNYERYSVDPQAALSKWEYETQRVASRCVNPDAVADGRSLSATQLVVGRVQSGKTTNFTGVMALLADNRYPLFIVLGGTTLPLLRQTEERLKSDLGVKNFHFYSTTDRSSGWAKEMTRKIRQVLIDSRESKRNPLVDDPNPICITTLKIPTGHMLKVNALLKNLREDPAVGPMLYRVPVVIVDDESDAASPDANLRNTQNSATATNRAINKMRDNLPVNSYIGYTATPMAQQVTPLDDSLKPERVTVLEPGRDYLGVEHLFGRDSGYAREIPAWTDVDPLPESLKKAVGTFLVSGVLFHHEEPSVRAKYVSPPLLTNSPDRPISMLVHIDRAVRYTTNTHKLLATMLQDWISLLSKPPSPDGKLEFQTQYLFRTYLSPALEEFEARQFFEELDFLRRVRNELVDLQVRLIIGKSNSPEHALEGVSFPSEDELKAHGSWIFVGAQLLDRGQTLPNLISTYLGRPSGGGAKGTEAGGNVDTLLQRGRFFGYRKQYEPLLRGYFSPTALESFKAISQIEPRMRKWMEKIDVANFSLQDWRTMVELDADWPKLSWVRSSIMPKTTTPVVIDKWNFTNHLFGRAESNTNAQLVLRRVDEWNKIPSFRSSWDGDDFIVKITGDEAIRFLDSWSCVPADSRMLSVLREVLNLRYQQEGFKHVDFRFMGRKAVGLDSLKTTYFRSYPSDYGSVFPNLQGLMSGSDRALYSSKNPTFQVKFFRMVAKKDRSIVLFEPAVGLAIHLGPTGRFLADGN